MRRPVSSRLPSSTRMSSYGFSHAFRSRVWSVFSTTGMTLALSLNAGMTMLREISDRIEITEREDFDRIRANLIANAIPDPVAEGVAENEQMGHRSRLEVIHVLD